MSVYKAEDFEQAMFAVHPDPDAVYARYAARMNRDPEFPWLLDGVPGNGDEHMARDGWVPVVEPRITEDTLRRVEERAERKRQKLIAHIASVEAAVRDRNRTIEELYVARQEASRRESAAHDRVVTLLDTKKTHERTVHELRHDLKVALAEVAELGDENDRLGRVLQAPLTLDALEAAWEAAEEADECRKGDVLIMQDPAEGYSVWRTGDADYLSRGTRVLSRAPREPWADLADVLRAHTGEPDPDETARLLHERGVRVAGGEQK